MPCNLRREQRQGAHLRLQPLSDAHWCTRHSIFGCCGVAVPGALASADAVGRSSHRELHAQQDFDLAQGLRPKISLAAVRVPLHKPREARLPFQQLEGFGRQVCARAPALACRRPCIRLSPGAPCRDHALFPANLSAEKRRRDHEFFISHRLGQHRHYKLFGRQHPFHRPRRPRRFIPLSPRSHDGMAYTIIQVGFRTTTSLRAKTE